MQDVFFMLVICARVFESQGENFFYLISQVIIKIICHVYRQFPKNNFEKCLSKFALIHNVKICSNLAISKVIWNDRLSNPSCRYYWIHNDIWFFLFGFSVPLTHMILSRNKKRDRRATMLPKLKTVKLLNLKIEHGLEKSILNIQVLLWLTL